MLNPSQATMLYLLARKVLQHSGTDTPVIAEDNRVLKFRSARVGDVALLEKPADDQAPKRIDCYAVALEDFAGFGRDGMKYKLDPKRILFSIRWLHNAEPPDLETVTLQEPALWLDRVALTLLGAAASHDAELRYKLPTDLLRCAQRAAQYL